MHMPVTHELDQQSALDNCRFTCILACCSIVCPRTHACKDFMHVSMEIQTCTYMCVCWKNARMPCLSRSVSCPSADSISMLSDVWVATASPAHLLCGPSVRAACLGILLLRGHFDSSAQQRDLEQATISTTAVARLPRWAHVALASGPCLWVGQRCWRHAIFLLQVLESFALVAAPEAGRAWGRRQGVEASWYMLCVEASRAVLRWVQLARLRRRRSRTQGPPPAGDLSRSKEDAMAVVAGSLVEAPCGGFEREPPSS